MKAIQEELGESGSQKEIDEMRKKDNKKYKVVWIVGEEDILDMSSVI